jgi:shikimate kinase
MKIKNNILLIGFMGVGKGTTARAFSKEYGVYIIDTDDLIESKENKKIPKIFEKYGEKYFRELEQETANWLERSVKNTLISCGGGFYKVKNLNKIGKVVLLDAPFDWIYNRLLTAKNSKAKLAKRPLFQDLKKAKALYKERMQAYRKKADFILKVDKLSQKELLKELAKIAKS